MKKYLHLLAVAATLFSLTAKADSISSSGLRVLENPISDGNFVMRINDGGVKKDAFTITGATGASIIGASGNTDTHTINGPILATGGNSALVLGTTDARIRSNSSDGTDNAVVYVAGGGQPSSTRGSYLQLTGNEHADVGVMRMVAGTAASGTAFEFYAGAGASLQAKISHDARTTIFGAGNVSGSNFKLAIAGSSGTAADAATIQLGDNFAGASRQWAISNGRGPSSTNEGRLYFTISNAVNTDAMNGSGVSPGYWHAGGLNVTGALTKSSGSFVIDHPDPAKAGKKLRHQFVESPTAGENLYRFRVEADAAETVEVDLPDYWRHLNENPQAWVSADQHFGRAFARVSDDGTKLLVTTDAAGAYNVLLVGTRKDEAAMKWWNDEKWDGNESKEVMQ